MYKRFLLNQIFCMLLLIGLGSSVAAQQAPGVAFTEYQLKAAFLYNFSLFVEWPQEAFVHDSTRFRIGVLGEDPFGTTLQRVIAGKKVHGKRLEVRHYRRVEQVRDCHLLYISRTERKNQGRILAYLKNSSVLTIGESENFLKAGGMIQLFNKSRRVRFNINPEVAKEAGLQMSSRLLSLAENLRLSYDSEKNTRTSSKGDIH